MARSMDAPLSPHEEVTLRRIALGALDPKELSRRDLRRLEHLDLIIVDHARPTLTPLGRERYKALPRAMALEDVTESDFIIALERSIRSARDR